MGAGCLQPEERNFDSVDGLFNELLGRAILPSIPIHDIDDPWLLDCGFGKGAWIETVLDGNENATVSPPPIIFQSSASMTGMPMQLLDPGR